jgi:hypothetical protein
MDYGCRYPMVSAAVEATCAACRMAVQFRDAIFGAFSGTTIESPGFNTAFMGSPDHKPELFFAESTDPSARTTNTALLSAI